MNNTTIIITTHYIEEAQQAHMVGLMRNGRLLAEAPPQDLITTHRLNVSCFSVLLESTDTNIQYTQKLKYNIYFSFICRKVIDNFSMFGKWWGLVSWLWRYKSSIAWSLSWLSEAEHVQMSFRSMKPVSH